MTKLFGCVAATVIGAAIVTATPAASFRGSGGFGGMRIGRQVFVGGPFFYDYYIPYYYDFVPYHGNYCWQQVWTPSGWQWVDACSSSLLKNSGFG
jgi:hypothetical protein